MVVPVDQDQQVRMVPVEVEAEVRVTLLLVAQAVIPQLAQVEPVVQLTVVLVETVALQLEQLQEL